MPFYRELNKLLRHDMPNMCYYVQHELD